MVCCFEHFFIAECGIIYDWLFRRGNNNNGGRCASGFYILHLTASALNDGTQDAVWARCVLQR